VRSGVEGPFFLHLTAIGGEKVSPLRTFGAPVETTEISDG
jgi:hypothetical protein